MTTAHNLPAELTTFVGREREIAQIGRFVSRARLLTLIGAGGAGKSRLAFRVAGRLVQDFAGGVWLVELASLADAALVPHRVAAALNVPEQPGRAVVDALADALSRSALLLVLDNCEHLAAACGALAASLLRTCPDLRILATSRVPLGVPGETLWRVPSLSLPTGGGITSLDEARRSEAVCLFVERAQSGEPGFALTSANASAVVQICRRLDGMPLAIELAAARASVLSPAQILTRLDDRFRFLTQGAAAVLPRHQTLRATMDWSYGLLGEAERALLRRLSVFAGGWTLEAAEAICGGDAVAAADVLDALGRLVDGSLVIASTATGTARYRLLETVRQYGGERLLEAGDAALVRGRHLDWYLALAEDADAGLRGPNEAVWLARLESEHDNLLAALDHARGRGDGIMEARLARALEWFWHIVGYWTEGRARLESVLARGVAEETLLPKVYVGAARLAYRMGDRRSARTLCEQGLALSRRVADRLGEACCVLWLGILAMEDGELERARPLLESSLEIYQTLGDNWWKVEALSFLGTLAAMRGAYDEARRLHEESLAVARETANRNNITTALRNLAHLALRRGDDDQAAAFYSESLRLCRNAEVVTVVVESAPFVERGALISPAQLLPGVITECLDGLARVACERRAYEPAARLFGATEASMEGLGGRLPLWSDISEHERYVDAARAALGPAGFAGARNAGRAMTLEQAVDYALAVTAGIMPRGGGKGQAPRKPPGGRAPVPAALTAREREVAALVADGLTNREIAAALVVTERTAETHVQNILNKLAFSSRAQVAAWAVEQGLKKPAPRRA
jgi:predicted ATPase/DNA-binding CsgD family transcriptional regulator